MKGYAVERVQSDAASWNASISAIEKSEAAAYAKVKKSASAAKEFLLKNGAKEDKLIFLSNAPRPEEAALAVFDANAPAFGAFDKKAFGIIYGICPYIKSPL